MDARISAPRTGVRANRNSVANPAACLTRRRALSWLAVAVAGLAAPWSAWAQSAQDLAASGHELLAQGKAAEAVSTLTEAARLDPANAWIWNLLGRAWLLLGEARHATESFQAALRADSEDGYARMMLEVLAQRPLAPAQAKSGRPRRPSPLEEEARKEREQFLASGKLGDRQRLILLDPGHGGSDPGVTSPSGLLEKDLTLDMAKLLAEAMAAQGWQTLLTRDADYGVPPKQGPPGIHQYLTGWHAGRLLAESRAEAGRVQEGLKSPGPSAGGGLQAAPLAVLDAALTPSLMVQAGYLSNAADAKALASRDFRRDLAQALAKALTA
jgi:N-acetylmuramoyl-L-alanine amidase